MTNLPDFFQNSVVGPDDVVRIAEQHAEAIMCHLAHVRDLRLTNDQFDVFVEGLSEELLVNLRSIDARAEFLRTEGLAEIEDA